MSQARLPLGAPEIACHHNLYAGINVLNAKCNSGALLTYPEGSGHGRDLDPAVFKNFYNWLKAQVRASEIEATS